LKIKLIQTGKTGESWLREGISVYQKRLQHYLVFESHELVIPSGIKLSSDKQLRLEADKLLSLVKPGDWLVLLDDKGSAYSSNELADWLNKKMVRLQGDLLFAVGGAYGFHETVINRANEKMSLSPMTFTHQMVRLIFTEQLYRAMTILRNEPYHHS
jgi:23S rRNA (pseudouridine1915-N3)-methyltransferase